MTDFSELFQLFDTLPLAFVPEHQPKAGTTYLYKWNDDFKPNDWRADGYHWRQTGTKKTYCTAGQLTKIYFQVSFQHIYFLHVIRVISCFNDV